jgi:hypothetical protein
MPNVSEQEMRIYLLGGLSPERQTELAALIHDDAALQEELLALKEELFDQYLAGSLTADEQLYFKTHFLSTESGQQKLHFARLFQSYRDEHSFAINRVPAPVTPARVSAPLFASFHQNPAYVVSLIVIAGLLAALVFWISKSPTTHFATHTTPALTLSAGSNRSGGTIKEMRAPSRNDKVNLELELTKSDFKKYKTQLFRENKEVESQGELQTTPRNAHYVVHVTFTGELLTPGDYQLQLSGVLDSGQPTYIDSYAFRVTPGNVSTDAESDRDRLAR